MRTSHDRTSFRRRFCRRSWAAAWKRSVTGSRPPGKAVRRRESKPSSLGGTSRNDRLSSGSCHRLDRYYRRTGGELDEKKLSASASPAQTIADTVFAPGESFGDYELISLVARGGMGVVFKARHTKLNRLVALKMILAGQLACPADIQRFRSEAQAAARLDHPGIVPVYEVGECQGLHYFTMAFVEGASLAERLHEGPLDALEAARLVREIAAIIHFAHDNGVIHRDLKPGNVLIDKQRQPKLTDFGLAKRTDGAGGASGSGQLLGTPSYMAPEQANGTASVGPAADIYGLGALLFALLTGRPPFQAATMFDTVVQVMSSDPPAPTALNSAVPRDLETICLKCLEKAPGKRYSSAADFQDDVDRFLSGRPILARPVGLWERGRKWVRRRPGPAASAAVTVLALAAMFAVVVDFNFRLKNSATPPTLNGSWRRRATISPELRWNAASLPSGMTRA